MSFSSRLLADGGFPPAAQVPHHIISPVVLFRKLPEMAALKKSWEDSFLTYERFHSWLDRENGMVWIPTEINLEEHFVVSHLSHDVSEDLCMKTAAHPLPVP